MNLFNSNFSRVVFHISPITPETLKKLLEEQMLQCKCGGTNFNVVITTNLTLKNAQYSKEFKTLSGTPNKIETSILQLSCATCGDIVDPTAEGGIPTSYCYWCGKPISGLHFKGTEGKLYHSFCANLIGVPGRLVGE